MGVEVVVQLLAGVGLNDVARGPITALSAGRLGVDEEKEVEAKRRGEVYELGVDNDGAEGANGAAL